LADFDRYRLAILNDIFIVDETYAAIFCIADHYREVNAPFVGQLFGKLQNNYFIDAMILAISRIFDTRSDVLSIPGLIKSCGRFVLKNRDDFVSELRVIGIPEKTAEIIRTEAFSPRAVKELQKSMPLRDHVPALRRILDRRHTNIAHRAIAASSSAPFFADVKECNELASFDENISEASTANSSTGTRS